MPSDRSTPNNRLVSSTSTSPGCLPIRNASRSSASCPSSILCSQQRFPAPCLVCSSAASASANLTSSTLGPASTYFTSGPPTAPSMSGLCSAWSPVTKLPSVSSAACCAFLDAGG